VDGFLPIAAFFLSTGFIIIIIIGFGRYLFAWRKRYTRSFLRTFILGGATCFTAYTIYMQYLTGTRQPDGFVGTAGRLDLTAAFYSSSSAM
jgi:hypothetical protein